MLSDINLFLLKVLNCFRASSLKLITDFWSWGNKNSLTISGSASFETSDTKGVITPWNQFWNSVESGDIWFKGKFDIDPSSLVISILSVLYLRSKILLIPKIEFIVFCLAYAFFPIIEAPISWSAASGPSFFLF